jgi:hypothetical protein
MRSESSSHATFQALTALVNVLNNYRQSTVGKKARDQWETRVRSPEPRMRTRSPM